MGQLLKSYIYYGCTRSKDLDCKNKYIREKDLIKEFTKLIDRIDLDKIGMKKQIEKEINRYQNFRVKVLGNNEEEIQNKKEINIRNYAKYLLKEGSIYEKRELLSCLKSKIILENKEIYLKE